MHNPFASDKPEINKCFSSVPLELLQLWDLLRDKILMIYEQEAVMTLAELVDVETKITRRCVNFAVTWMLHAHERCE